MRKLFLLVAACGGICFAGGKYHFKRKQERYFQWYKTVYQWLLLRQDKIQIVDYFRNNGYKRVTIYGMGELGKLFLRELRDTDVEIPYVIDQNAGSISVSGVRTILLREVKEDVDVIVVSVVDKYEAIKADIEQRVNVPVVSLEDVLFGL